MPQYFDNIPELPSERRKLSLTIFDTTFTFMSDNGVFSKNQVDVGSCALLKVVLSTPLQGKILDLGCGYGVIGLTLAYFHPQATFVLADINDRALVLANENKKQLHLENVTILQSNIYENINDLFRTIVINPPIRAGKKVIYAMFEGAFTHLEDGGSLFIVIRKSHGAPSASAFIKSVFGNCSLLKKEKGYYIYEAKKQKEKKI